MPHSRYDFAGLIILMKEMYGAPSSGVMAAVDEYETINKKRAEYSPRLMYSLLTELTVMEIDMKNGKHSADYDYKAFSIEDRVFERGNIVHVLRHLKYDRHEPHSHNFFELICQASGESEVLISSERVKLSQGVVYLLSPGTEHCIEKVADDAILLKILLRKTDFDEIYRQLLRSDTLLSKFFSGALYSENGGWLSFDAGGDKDITDLLLRLRYHEVRSAPTDPMMKEALVMQFLCMLVDKHIGSAKTSTEPNSVAKIISDIRTDYKTITLEAVSEKYHFSPGYVSRILKRATGNSFTELVEDLKLEHAAGLLKMTDMSVEDIATASGFGCREFFHRKFKAHFGITPSKFRKSR